MRRTGPLSVTKILSFRKLSRPRAFYKVREEDRHDDRNRSLCDEEIIFTCLHAESVNSSAHEKLQQKTGSISNLRISLLVYSFHFISRISSKYFCYLFCKLWWKFNENRYVFALAIFIMKFLITKRVRKTVPRSCIQFDSQNVLFWVGLLKKFLLFFSTMRNYYVAHYCSRGSTTKPFFIYL